MNPEMESAESRELLLVRLIDAPPEKLFRAWTEPALLKQWFTPKPWSDSREGTEPHLLERDFKGKHDWRVLDAAFIDQAPDGFGTALSFFSDEAFHFYLPAYLLADLDGRLQRADPVFHLTHGLDCASRDEKINPGRYGERTWFAHARHKFAMFNAMERSAILSYLSHMRDTGVCAAREKRRIDEAIDAFWARQAA